MICNCVPQPLLQKKVKGGGGVASQIKVKCSVKHLTKPGLTHSTYSGCVVRYAFVNVVVQMQCEIVINLVTS